MSVEPNLPDKGCPVPSLSDACPASPRGQHCPAQKEARKPSLGFKNVTSARGNLDVTDFRQLAEAAIQANRNQSDFKNSPLFHFHLSNKHGYKYLTALSLSYTSYLGYLFEAQSFTKEERNCSRKHQKSHQYRSWQQLGEARPSLPDDFCRVMLSGCGESSYTPRHLASLCSFPAWQLPVKQTRASPTKQAPS